MRSPPWRLLRQGACLAVYLGRVIVGGMGSFRKVFCMHTMGLSGVMQGLKLNTIKMVDIAT